MSNQKVLADFMYQTDFDANCNPTSFTNSSTNKIQPKNSKISPKSLNLKLNFETNSSNTFRTPKIISKSLKYGKHHHSSRTDKPLEKTFLNPIIPKYNSFHKRPSKTSKFPYLKINVQALQTNYLRSSNYPMSGNNKMKYSAVLDSFHFNF